MKKISFFLTLVIVLLSVFISVSTPVSAQSSTCTAYLNVGGVSTPYTYPCAGGGGSSAAVLSTTGPVLTASSVGVWFGDSFVASGGGTCSETFNSAPAIPTGTCLPDVVGAFYTGSKVVNLGVASTCATTYPGGTNYCTTFGNAGTTRYVAQLIPYCTSTGTNWIFMEYAGINESQHFADDTGFTPTLFQSAIDTMVSACIAAGEPADHIVVMTSPHASNVTNIRTVQASAAIANVAMKHPGMRVALGYEALIACWNDQSVPTPSVCTSDSLHPNASLGIPLLAAAYENASYGSAVAAQYWNTLSAYSQQPQKGLQLQGYPGTNVALAIGASSRAVGNDDISFNNNGNNSTLFGQIQSGTVLDMYDNTGGGYVFSLKGGTGDLTLKGPVITPQGVCPGNKTAAGSACFYAGVGVPVFTAFSGSVFLRSDGVIGTSSLYLNSSTSGTSGSTWTAKF